MDTPDKIFIGFISVVAIIIIFVAFIGLFAPKHVVGYSLGVNGSSLAIRVDIENCNDDIIPLVNVDYERAIILVDSLNAQLQYYKESNK